MERMCTCERSQRGKPRELTDGSSASGHLQKGHKDDGKREEKAYAVAATLHPHCLADDPRHQPHPQFDAGQNCLLVLGLFRPQYTPEDWGESQGSKTELDSTGKAATEESPVSVAPFTNTGKDQVASAACTTTNGPFLSFLKPLRGHRGC